MGRTSIVIDAVNFAAGVGTGVLVTRTVAPERDAMGFTAEERADAERRAVLLRAGTYVRGVAQAIVHVVSGTPGWALPDTEGALIEELVKRDLISPEFDRRMARDGGSTGWRAALLLDRDA